jgi:hypothetical protein
MFSRYLCHTSCKMSIIGVNLHMVRTTRQRQPDRTITLGKATFTPYREISNRKSKKPTG